MRTPTIELSSNVPYRVDSGISAIGPEWVESIR